MTKQEMFDTVATHLLTQRKRSLLSKEQKRRIVDNNKVPGICAYRGKGGLKCAIGTLIDDAEYKEEFEGQSARLVLGELRDKFGFVDKAPTYAEGFGAFTDLAVALQEVHDDYLVKEWAEALRIKARHHGLDSTIVDRLEANHAAKGVTGIAGGIL